MQEPASSPRPGVFAALAALAGASVSLSALHGPFIFDDIPLILGNHYVHGFEHWRRWFTEALWSTNFDVSVQHRSFWRPLVVASYALDWWWGNGSPVAFHVTNGLLHAANACLLFYVLRGWVAGAWPALAGALTFAVHPVQTETAAWISGRTDSLAALGLLTALLGMRLYRRRALGGVLLSCFGVCFAAASKEIAVVIPVLAFVEIWSERGGPLTPERALSILRRCAPYLAFAVAFALLHRTLDRRVVPSGVGLAERIPLVLEAYGRYATLLAWPDDLTLGRALLRHEAGVIQPHFAYAVLGALSLAAAAALARGSWRRRPRVTLGLGACIALLLPVSGVVWLGYAVLVSPRFLYVAMIAVALLVAALLASSLGRHRAVPAVALGVLAAWMARSVLRAGDFASDEAFWRREITQNPGYAAAHEHFISRELQSGRPHAALQLARRALAEHARAQAAEGEQRANLILKCIAAVLALTADLEHERLRAVQEFVEGALLARPVRLALPDLGVDIDLGRERRSLPALVREERTLRVMAAEAAQRRGDDTSACAHIERALAGCSECWTLLSTSALILARAGRIEEALTLVERARAYSVSEKLTSLVAMIRGAEPWQRQRRVSTSPVFEAGFHSALGSFGRAYAAARPAFADPPKDPEAIASLAQLAFQAGDVATSRRLLASIFSEPTVQSTLELFARSAPWRDRPRSTEEWLPIDAG